MEHEAEQEPRFAILRFSCFKSALNTSACNCISAAPKSAHSAFCALTRGRKEEGNSAENGNCKVPSTVIFKDATGTVCNVAILIFILGESLCQRYTSISFFFALYPVFHTFFAFDNLVSEIYLRSVSTPLNSFAVFTVLRALLPYV